MDNSKVLRSVICLLLLVGAALIITAGSSSGTETRAEEIFSLSVEGNDKTDENGYPVFYIDNTNSYTFVIDIQNNEADVREAHIIMTHPFTGNMTTMDVDLGTLKMGAMGSDTITYALNFPPEYTLTAGEQKMVKFVVKEYEPDNNQTEVLQDTLLVVLEMKKVFSFEIKDIEVVGYGGDMIVDNLIEVVVTGNNTGNVRAPIVFKLYVDGELYTESQEGFDPFITQTVRIDWTPSEPGKYELKVEVYAIGENSAETGILAEKTTTAEIEEDGSIPPTYWVIAGVVVIIIVIAIGVIIRMNRNKAAQNEEKPEIIDEDDE